MKKYRPNSRDEQLFQQHVQHIDKLDYDKVTPPTSKMPKIQPNQHKLPPEETPITTSADKLFYTRKPLPQKVLRKLKQGQYNPEGTADLHGLTVAEAKQLLEDFLTESLQEDAFCILVIHGKGRHQPEQPILKNQVNHWLRHYPFVLAFCSATINDGGTGAVYVLLEKDYYIER